MFLSTVKTVHTNVCFKSCLMHVCQNNVLGPSTALLVVAFVLHYHYIIGHHQLYLCHRRDRIYLMHFPKCIFVLPNNSAQLYLRDQSDHGCQWDRKTVPGFNLILGLSLWSLHVLKIISCTYNLSQKGQNLQHFCLHALPMSAWVLFGYSGFLPQPKHMHSTG